MRPQSTIAAISSAAGPAARMIVRLSGPGALRIGSQMCPISSDARPAAMRTRLSIAGADVPIWLYLYRSPRSYTGEDLVEFHIPGNPLLARMLLQELLARGATPAEPGEFTARAYFNGRMGLEQAEGVAATIAAHGEDELRAARQLAAGELSQRLAPIMEPLVQTLALVEVGIDFSEEDVTLISPDELRSRIDAVDASIHRLINSSARFDRLSHEPQFVLVGRPNAGKSTLLNALAGFARSVVSPIPGTTRDLLSAEVTLDRGMIRLIDAAGLDDAPPPPDHPHSTIARQMRERSLQAVESADFVILVRDMTDPRPPLKLNRDHDLLILTKADLTIPAPSARRSDAPVRHGSLAPSPSEGEGWGEGGSSGTATASVRESGLSDSQRPDPHPNPLPGRERGPESPPSIAVSALTGLNMSDLRAALSTLAFARRTTSSSLALNTRHLGALDDARSALSRARAAAESGPEIVALELRESLDCLGQILGQVTPDDVLSRVFASFCIGK